MTDNLPARRGEMMPAGNQLDVLSVADAFVKSGYFSDVKSQAQAVVKILAGQEAGFGPMASLMGIYIVQGKPAWGANLMATAVKKSGRYDYRILQLDNTVCELEFYEHGKSLGKSRFTMDDAKAAKLTNKEVWQSFARNMLFARAMSNGCRWYCADVFGGVTPYTPEELNGSAPVEEAQTPTVTVSTLEPTPIRPQAQANPEPEPDDIDGWGAAQVHAEWAKLADKAASLGIEPPEAQGHTVREVKAMYRELRQIVRQAEPPDTLFK